MSIANEISRLQEAKSCIKAAIESKGVTVGSNVKLDCYADCIDAISGGGNIDFCVDYILVGGGGGGSGGGTATNTYGPCGITGNGGGGGQVLAGTEHITSYMCISLGDGGAGGSGTNYSYGCSIGCDGGNSCISFGNCSIVAQGGKGGCTNYGSNAGKSGNSGSGCSGISHNGTYCLGGGGAGASQNGGVKRSGVWQCSDDSYHCRQNGGAGLCGYGGGGGGGYRTYEYPACSVDGGGAGASYSTDATNGVNGGGGGGGRPENINGGPGPSGGGSGGKGLAVICYKADGSCGGTVGFGGDICTCCNGYCIHCFTKNGVFILLNA